MMNIIFNGKRSSWEGATDFNNVLCLRGVYVATSVVPYTHLYLPVYLVTVSRYGLVRWTWKRTHDSNGILVPSGQLLAMSSMRSRTHRVRHFHGCFCPAFIDDGLFIKFSLKFLPKHIEFMICNHTILETTDPRLGLHHPTLLKKTYHSVITSCFIRLLGSTGIIGDKYIHVP